MTQGDLLSDQSTRLTIFVNYVVINNIRRLSVNVLQNIQTHKNQIQ